jgi:hypothetical protein
MQWKLPPTYSHDCHLLKKLSKLKFLFRNCQDCGLDGVFKSILCVLTAWNGNVLSFILPCTYWPHAKISWTSRPHGNFKFWQYTWHIVDILQNKYSFMRSGVPTPVIVRITIFEHMPSCHLPKTDKHFEGTSCLQFQSRICRQQFSPKCW